ncbi:hypothetical protein C6P40_004938 [Pichia californica]|uniref:C2H2-type domain-containing protein n=1 Tax=Pichia californica TaxID=460514 RepID=A0A9P7BGP6_9ASCO|nr:hypothetical protein C6P42_003177 [[Candida] californica]KAG0689480.1 hypothetical protein C6P40_004938 [[Candida] californica]
MDFNNESNNNTTTLNNDTSNGGKSEKELLQILNSQRPDQNNQNVSLINTNITDEDVAFLKAANEVIKIHQNNVDPTIRDILNRLQYSNSPHGGMPISMQYLKSIGATENDNDLRERMSLLSTNDAYDNKSDNVSSRHDSIISQISDYNNRDHLNFNNNHNNNNNTNTNNNESTSGYIVPLFTENPLRNPPTNYDFPQFSLDIFKNNEDIQINSNNNSNDNNNIKNQRTNQQSHFQNLNSGISNNSLDSQNKISSLLNYPIFPVNHSNNNGFNNDIDNEEEEEEEEEVDDNDMKGRGRGRGGKREREEVKIQRENDRDEEDDEEDEEEEEGYGEDEDDDEEEEEEGRGGGGGGGGEYDNDKNGPGYMGDRRHSANNKKSRKISNQSEEVDNNGEILRNFKCSNCGISFKRSSDLKRHEKIHLKVPPNICPLCHKGFARKDALKRHVDTLTCKRNRMRLLKQLEEEKNGGLLNHM